MDGNYERREHHEFLTASAAALADGNLQAALSQLGETLGARNRAAYAALEDSSLLRDRARAIKDDTLAHLAEHLETLEASVIRNGGAVHFAADAEDARRIIIGILQKAQARRAVKSKSMTSEEIHLNSALAECGITPIETDFGEYIIQVAGHRPSHLVAPAIHLRTGQVAELLSRDAGEALPDDAERLAAYARKRLRAEFASADAGITGGNFVIAETGTLVLVSNEGNARLTTTLPRLHVALVGIEKVIPRLADLPVFLKVLARGATGQKLSIYTSLITGPRRPDELDGADEFHLVLLDNGRSRILAGPLRESLFCIRCGACLNACPIFRSVGGHAYGGIYAGPIGAVLTPLYDGLKANHHLPQASSLCGACQAACPVKIAIPEMLIQLREALHQQPGELGPGEALAYRVWSFVARRPRLYRLATWLAARSLSQLARVSPLVRQGGEFRRGESQQAEIGSGDGIWFSRLPGPISGWTGSRDFPAPARRRFRDWWKTAGHD